jgi:hypothetical protein
MSGPQGRALIPATATTRRLRALAVMGWPVAELASLIPARPATIRANQAGRRSVTARTAGQVADLYDQIWDRAGPSAAAGQHARDQGWAPPLAWDDATIGDPDVEPAGIRLGQTLPAGRMAPGGGTSPRPAVSAATLAALTGSQTSGNDWRDRAACGTSGTPDAWHADRTDAAAIAEAKAICRRQCPVRENCLAHALSRPEILGIWGGLDQDERKRALILRRPAA